MNSTFMKHLLDLPAPVIYDILNSECLKQDTNEEMNITIMNIPIFTLINELVRINGLETFDFMNTRLWLRTIATMNIFEYMDAHVWLGWDNTIVRNQITYILSGRYKSRVHDLIDLKLAKKN